MNIGLIIWVKLTQGTGRGTCWWSILLITIFILNLLCIVIERILPDLNFSNLLDFQTEDYETDTLSEFIGSTLFFFNFSFFSEYFGNLLLIYFFYMFFKLVLLSSIVELMWPTHFFNKKNSIFKNKVKNRLFIEFFLKSYSKSTYLNVLNISVCKLLS